MKKIVALLTLLAMAFSFAACSSHECEGCGKKATEKYEGHWFCDSCYELVKLVGDFTDLID